MRRPAFVELDTLAVAVAVLVLSSLSVSSFAARVTDLSALRVLAGEVPYRDFWTLYAPGTIVTLAVAFRLFGRELLVSNLLGVVTAAAVVTVYYRLVRKVVGRAWGLGLVGLAVTALGLPIGGASFATYLPAYLLLLVAVSLAVPRVTRDGVRWVLAPGLLFGAAALYKHDVAGYAALSAALAMLAERWRSRAEPRLPPLLVMGAATAVLPLSATLVLVALGAGPDLWNDVVRFPLTDFPLVRPEVLPLVPRLRGSLANSVDYLSRWASGAFPFVALAIAAGTLGRRWRELDVETRCLAAFAASMVAFHAMAARVQLNTHASSLVLWSALLTVAGLRLVGGRRGRFVRGLAVTWLAAWAALVVAEPVYHRILRASAGDQLDLPGLHGMRSTDAGWMRRLAAAVAEAAPPEAPLVLVGRRNDVLIHANSIPYWLSERRPATRYHELHPGITDTEAVQREMIADLERGPLPVVVREHRHSDGRLEMFKERMLAKGVRLGSTLLDEWVQSRYESGPRFGRYELMRPRATLNPNSAVRLEDPEGTLVEQKGFEPSTPTLRTWCSPS